MKGKENIMKNTDKILKCEEFGCYFRITDGFLQWSPMLVDGTNEDDWGDVEDFYPNVVAVVNEFYDTKYGWNVKEDLKC